MTWDGENRLVKLERPAWTQPAGGFMAPANPQGIPPNELPAATIEFKYDGLSRLIERKVTRGIDPPEVEGYQWDGWKLIMIAKLNTDGTYHRRKWSCVWRPDIGSSLYARSDWMRAGGVGGLAWLQTGAVQSYSYGTGSAEVHVPLADHMGNVRHYYQFKASGKTVTGQLVASYEYDAFGREVRAWGTNTPVTSQPPGLPANRPWADLLPFHYSSKLRDADSGFNYYGYRFYDPGAGRWLNRDPIGERGGLNLYGMVGNDGVNTFDHLGLKGCKVKSLKVSELDRNNPINDDGSRNYTPIEPGTSATPIPVTGTPRKRANLRVDAEFEKPDCGCCEVRQKVRKGKNAPLKEDTGEGAAADGFKGSEGAYGHRNQAGVPGFDTYYNQRNKYGDAIPNKSGGSKYESTDKPSPGRNEGVWTFVIEVIDTCNGNKVVDMTDFSIDWSK